MGKKAENISSKVRNETRVTTLSTLIQHNFGVPSQRNKTERRKKKEYKLERK
jgi:hypothetical protein